MKDKIIELLGKNAKEGWNGDVEAVGYTDFESVAEQLVKLFSIYDVSKSLNKITGCQWCDSDCTKEKTCDCNCHD